MQTDRTQSKTGSAIHRCWAEIDLDALENNLRVAQDQVSSGSELIAVVKANAYGHGVIPIVQRLRQRTRWFAVANLHEADEIRAEVFRESGHGAGRILVLGPALAQERPGLVDSGYTPVCSTVEECVNYAHLAAKAGHGEERPFPIHLKLDTGMGRMGLLADDATEVVKEIQQLSSLRIEAVMTHFPSADEDKAYTEDQIVRFRQLLESLRAHGVAPDYVHSQNSSGILDYGDRAMQLCRPGLMLYGVSPTGACQEALRPVMHWKSRVVLVRTLPRGHGVSYGRTWITQGPTRVATISAGYADGYPRLVSNRGAHVIIRGQSCPLLGRVTMDLVMADVTGLGDAVEAGDEVLLLGRDEASGQEITASSLAALAETISYEIFCGVSARVPRISTS